MTIAVIKEGVRVDEKYFFGQFLTFMMMMMMMMMTREYFLTICVTGEFNSNNALNTCSRFLVLPVRDFLVNMYNFHDHIVHNQDGDC